MLFETKNTQAAEASLNSLWLKSKVISNNLANVDTPGFKASSVQFDEVLGRAVAGQDQTVAGKAQYRATVTQNKDRSVRIDGNNVSLEKEETELWKAYAQYSYLLDRMSGHYAAINTAINNMKR